jgi:hypothetical protein
MAKADESRFHGFCPPLQENLSRDFHKLSEENFQINFVRTFEYFW